MNNLPKEGRVHSIQTLGTLDGPGVRFVIFMQGCNLRCGCCHNPDTWSFEGGKIYTAEELLKRIMNYRTYFGKDGGVTVSGGEPLLQAEFIKELFILCHDKGINTCLDTSGSILNDGVKELLAHTDRVLLDIKYSTDEMYKKYVGCSIEKPLEFLEYLNEMGIKTTVRQVIIPSLNDNTDNLSYLSSLSKKCSCIDKIELLPFKKICKVKYDNMGLSFEFNRFDTPNKDLMDSLNKILEQ